VSIIDVQVDDERALATRAAVAAAGVYAPKVGASDPKRLFPWAQGLISAAMFLGVPEPHVPTAGKGRLAGFVGSDGRNYERFNAALIAVSEQLARVAEIGRYEISIDGPGVLDRNVALASGLGWVGKSTGVLTKDHGSWLMLGTVVTENPPHESMVRPAQDSRCGGCVECVRACPTGALGTAYRCDPGRCLSLYTQSPQGISAEVSAKMGTTIYGCDVCQDVCPVNLRADGPRVKVKEVLLTEIIESSDDELRERFPGLYFPGKRISLLRRNAAIGLENSLRV